MDSKKVTKGYGDNNHANYKHELKFGPFWNGLWGIGFQNRLPVFLTSSVESIKYNLEIRDKKF